MKLNSEKNFPNSSINSKCGFQNTDLAVLDCVYFKFFSNSWKGWENEIFEYPRLQFESFSQFNKEFENRDFPGPLASIFCHIVRTLFQRSVRHLCSIGAANLGLSCQSLWRNVYNAGNNFVSLRAWSTVSKLKWGNNCKFFLWLHCSLPKPTSYLQYETSHTCQPMPRFS